MRDRIAAGFRDVVSGDPTGQPDWVHGLAEGDDVGYFGPGSAAWAVHGSLTTLVGGIRALLMQALHPGALAGVMQHSRYETDALGRLAGTARWLTVVTFGDRAMADRECARVRGMHRKVSGVYEGAEGERAYSANDPDLLRWVHVAFTDSFLAAHRVWGGPIPGGEDAYVREWATAGELVGATDLPRSAAELKEQVRGFASQLDGSESARRTADFVRHAPIPLAGRPAYGVLFAGALSTLPEEYRRMLGLPDVPLAFTRPAVGALLGGLGLVLGDESPSMKATQARVARLATLGLLDAQDAGFDAPA
ncbi:MAG: DUF2236 domain-containing protein [Actinomycetales bacterium]|nr:DUF2236 domain-containing protein [Actinomycetales bacterium]